MTPPKIGPARRVDGRRQFQRRVIDTAEPAHTLRGMSIQAPLRSLAICIAWSSLALMPVLAVGGDWPRWRGPDLNGISPESDWSTDWPAAGPKQLWNATVGVGFASITIADGRAFTTGNQADQDTIYAFDAATGQALWKHSYPCPLDPHYYDGGTSATPTVDGARVYSLGRKGDLFCLDAATGKVLWSKNLNDALGLKGSSQTPEWGYAGSPLVQGDRLILNVGTAGLALEKSNGEIAWSTGKTRPGYASPVPFSLAGKPALAILGANALHAVDPSSGAVLWSYGWKTSYDVNAADPIVSGDRIFISSGYGHGATVLQVNAAGATRIWENKDLRNQLNSSVLIGGQLYGMDGDHGNKSSSLRCVEFATGTVKWTEKSIQPGGLMAANGKLVILSDGGELVVAEASPAGFKALARAQVLGGKCWTTPVLSHGRIYARNAKGNVVCVDVQRAAGAR